MRNISPMTVGRMIEVLQKCEQNRVVVFKEPTWGKFVAFVDSKAKTKPQNGIISLPDFDKPLQVVELEVEEDINWLMLD